MRFPNNLLFSGQGEESLSYGYAAGTLAGDAVTGTGQGIVGRGAAGDGLVGVVNKLEPGDTKASVQYKGVVDVPYSAAPTFTGPAYAVVDGTGKVTILAAGGTVTAKHRSVIVNGWDAPSTTVNLTLL